MEDSLSEMPVPEQLFEIPSENVSNSTFLAEGSVVVSKVDQGHQIVGDPL